MLVYRDAGAAIDFLCRAFGFEVIRRMEMPDGRVGHAELRYGASVLMLASVYPELGLASPAEMPARHCQLHCVVDDIDAHHAEARAHGATIATEPRRAEYGGWSYRAIDCEGHRWIFSQSEPDGEGPR